MNIPCILSDKIEISEYHASKIRQLVKDNGSPIRGQISTLLPESSKQRKYLHGCLIRLWVHMDGNDYQDSKVCDRYFEVFMLDNFPETQRIGKKIHVFGKSSKGSKMIHRVIEKLQEYLVENYGLEYSSDAMNPEKYKEWRDEIAMNTTDNWIQYCIKMKYI